MPLTYKMTSVSPFMLPVVRTGAGCNGTCPWQVCDRLPLLLSFCRFMAKDPRPRPGFCSRTRVLLCEAPAAGPGPPLFASHRPPGFGSLVCKMGGKMPACPSSQGNGEDEEPAGFYVKAVLLRRNKTLLESTEDALGMLSVVCIEVGYLL